MSQQNPEAGKTLSMEEFIHSMSSTLTAKQPLDKSQNRSQATRQEIIDRISKPVHQSMPIQYTNTQTILSQMKECKQIADQAKTVDNFQANSKLAQQQQNALKQAQLFQVEQFYEISEGNDDRLASDSEQEEYNEAQNDQKDTGSTQVFMKLITELNYVGTMQSALAVQIINQSIDFSILKFRQLFISNGGVTGLFKILNNMMLKQINETDRQIYIQQGLTRTDINVGYDVLLTLCTLLEISKDSRRAVLAEDAIRIALSLSRAKFDSSMKSVSAFKARALRMLAGCALDAKARNYMRRISIVNTLQKMFVQSVKDYEMVTTPDNASFICGNAMCLQNLMKSRRCLTQMIKTGGIVQLVNSLNKLYEHAKKSFAFPLVEDFCVICSQIKKPTEQLDSLLVLTIMNILRSVSTIKSGRAEIQAAKSGIERIVSVLDSSKGAKDNRIKQRAVAILANCAQDPGVDKSVREAQGLIQLSQLLRDSSKDDYEMLLAICRTLVAICRSGPYFGSAESCYPSDERDYLVYNQRNEDNIIALVEANAIENLTPHINIPLDILQNSDLDQQTLIVGQTEDKNSILVTKQKEARQLVVYATNALIPLLSAQAGRGKLRNNDALMRCLLNHLKIADVDVLIATLFAIATACQCDQDIVKHIIKLEADPKNKIEAQKFLFTLLNHKNLQVVTAAAMALNPICRNEKTATRQTVEKTRAFEIGRKITQTLQTVSQLLHRSYEFELNDSYSPRLVLEMKGWLMGIIAELAQDKENAIIFTDYNILEIVCNLLLDHASDKNTKVKRAYDFHIDQLIKEKGSLALATLSKIEMNVATVAEMNEGHAIRALVKCLQTPDGVAVFDISTKGSIVIGTKVDSCVHKFGAEVVFADYIADSAQRQQEKEKTNMKQNVDKAPKKKPVGQQSYKIDKDPQATPNPYSVVNRSVCCAMAELSKNRKCALLLRQYGAVYGLLTLAGSSDEMTQKQAAEAIQNIREQHICALEVYTNRKLSEFPEPQEFRSQFKNVNNRKVDIKALTAAADRMYEEYDKLFTNRIGMLGGRSDDDLARILNPGSVQMAAAGEDDVKIKFDEKSAAADLFASTVPITVMENPDVVKRASQYQSMNISQVSAQQQQQAAKDAIKKELEATTKKEAAELEVVEQQESEPVQVETSLEVPVDTTEKKEKELEKKEEQTITIVEGLADYRQNEDENADKDKIENVVRKKRIVI